MEKPKGASMSAIYQDTYVGWTEYSIMGYFNLHDPAFRGLGTVKNIGGLAPGAGTSSHPTTLKSTDSRASSSLASGVKRGADESSLSSSPVPAFRARFNSDTQSLSSSMASAAGELEDVEMVAERTVGSDMEEGQTVVEKFVTSSVSYSERMKSPLADLATKIVDIPISPQGHFKAAMAYLMQPATRASGYEKIHMSLSEAHEAIGRDMQRAFENFAATLTCPNCTPDKMSESETSFQLSALKQKIANIGRDGNVFLNGGIASDGRLVKSRVEMMQATLGHIEGALQAMGRRGEHITRETVIRTAVSC